MGGLVGATLRVARPFLRGASMAGMMIGHTVEAPPMPAAKIAITIDEELVWALDLWV